MVIAAGARIRADDMYTGEPESWTPVWTASTTNPTGYTGTGRYIQHGSWCLATAVFTCDTGFTDGTGTYRFSLPVAMSTFHGLEHSIGTMILRDTSGSARYAMVAMPTGAGASTVYAMTGGDGVTTMTDTSPVTPDDGDTVTMHVWYWTA